MQDILARIFVILLLVLYSGVALVFVITGIRDWVCRPIRRRLWGRRPKETYQRIKSTRREESPS